MCLFRRPGHRTLWQKHSLIFATTVTSEPTYCDKFKARLLAGELAPALEAMVWHYAYESRDEALDACERAMANDLVLPGCPSCPTSVPGADGGTSGTSSSSNSDDTDAPPFNSVEDSNLGDEYIADLEDAYPPGSLEHRRLILGKRGLMVAGDPIYGPYFDERIHVAAERQEPVEFDPRLPLYESWDFGTLRPAVVYGQFPVGGRMHLLGGICGDRLPLDSFVPMVIEQRAAWFAELPPGMLQTTCDPAGQAPNSHGSKTAMQTLHSFGIYPVVHENANDPRIRAGCIEDVIGYLRRRAHDGTPLFRLNPRFVVRGGKRGPKHLPMLQEAFEGGYCYDPKKTYAGTTYQGITPPLKDKLYEDLANATDI